MRFLNVILTLVLAVSPLRAADLIGAHAQLGHRFNAGAVLPRIPVRVLPGLQEAPKPQEKKDLWTSVVDEWKSALARFGVTQDHSQFSEKNKVRFQLSDGLPPGAIAAWGEEGILFNRRTYSRLVHQLGMKGADQETIAKIVALWMLPEIAHELRHGMNHAELQKKGFDILLPSKMDEAVAFADYVLVWRNPEYQKAYRDVFEQYGLLKGDPACERISKAWEKDGLEGMLSFVNQNPGYAKAMDNSCTQEVTLKALDKEVTSAKEMLDLTVKLKKDLTEADAEEKKLKILLDYLKAATAGDEERYEQMVESVALHGIPAPDQFQMAIDVYQKKFDRLDSALKNLRDPEKYKHWQNTFKAEEDKYRKIAQQDKQNREATAAARDYLDTRADHLERFLLQKDKAAAKISLPNFMEAYWKAPQDARVRYLQLIRDASNMVGADMIESLRKNEEPTSDTVRNMEEMLRLSGANFKKELQEVYPKAARTSLKLARLVVNDSAKYNKQWWQSRYSDQLSEAKYFAGLAGLDIASEAAEIQKLAESKK